MSANASRLAVLAARISELTAIVDKYHIETNTTHPSFEESYWKETSYPENIEQARIDLSDACRELDELVTGPRMLLQNKTYVSLSYDLDEAVPRSLPPSRDTTISTWYTTSTSRIECRRMAKSATQSWRQT